MNYSTYRFTLDIHHTKSQISIPIPHMDTAVQFFINLTDGGKPYKMEEGCTAKLFGKKADGTSLVDDCDIIDNGTRIHYQFNEQTASALGVCECEIRLYGNTGRGLTTPSFDILVVPRVLKDDEIIESEAERSAIDNLFLSENERVLAEEARDTAEQERIANENSRIEAEVARDSVEKAREAAEEIRKQNEIARGDAEVARADAESVRKQNEINREEKLKELITNLDTLNSAYVDGENLVLPFGTVYGENLLLENGTVQDENLEIENPSIIVTIKRELYLHQIVILADASMCEVHIHLYSSDPTPITTHAQLLAIKQHLQSASYAQSFYWRDAVTYEISHILPRDDGTIRVVWWTDRSVCAVRYTDTTIGSMTDTVTEV